MNGQNPSMVMPALIGGVFLGITSALPIIGAVNCACCALVIGGGIIASFLYIRDLPPHMKPLGYADGATLGLLTGVFGSFIWTAVDIPLTFFKLQIGSSFADLSKLEEALDDPSIPPVVREIVTDIFSSSGLSLGVILFQFLSNVVVAVIFATLGAIIGVAIFQKKAYTPGPPRPQAPPTPPTG